MKYKIQTLVVDSFGEVDIPEGWIPLNYVERLVSTSGKGTYEDTYTERQLIVLEPIYKIGK